LMLDCGLCQPGCSAPGRKDLRQAPGR
jgi:hypothetical protein